MIPEPILKLLKNHFVVMILVCTAPMLAVLLLTYSGLIGSWGLSALLVICPLGHLLMMRNMHGSAHTEGQKVRTTSYRIEDK